MQRPQAPPLRLGERQEAPVTRSAQGAICTVCQTRNQLGHRFCIACGSPLPVTAPVPTTATSLVAPAPADTSSDAAAPAPASPAAPVPAAPLGVAPAPTPVAAVRTPAPMPSPFASVPAPVPAGESMVTPSFAASAPSFASPPFGASPAEATPLAVPPGGVSSLGRSSEATIEPSALVPGALPSGPVIVPPVPTASMSAPIPEASGPVATLPRASMDVPTPLAVPSPLFRSGTMPMGMPADDPPMGSSTLVLEQAEVPPSPPSERTSARAKKATAPDGVAAMKVREQTDSMTPNQPLEALPLVSLAEPRAPAPAQQVCPRCRTGSDMGTPFCRVCGYALAAPAPAGAATAPATTAMPVATPVTSEPLAPPVPSNRPVLQVVADGPEKVTTFGRIVQLSKDGSDGASHAIVSESFDLGSREGSMLLNDDPYVSPRHARLLREGGHWYVVDLDSVNGVYLRVQGKRALSDGDLILLGQQVLRFEVVMDAEHALRPAVQHGVALFGTPQLPRLARLAQRTVEGVTRDVYHLSRAETSLGRETADIVFSDDPFLSRRHAVVSIDRAATACSIEDQGSSNGTFVAIRGRERLTGGEVLRVGLHLFRVELAGSERGIQS